MEAPTGVAAGAVLLAFGGALLYWCAAEVRLRRYLRHHGVHTMARVVADRLPTGTDDPAPELAYSLADRTEALVARPRGRTRLRRPARLSPGTLVQISYDPRQPSRLVLADGLRIGPSDAFWMILGAGCLAAGLAVLTAAIGG
ncbi:DUF3592 domain-containing protein [Peterkaempfera griseoplana]|uniref:DUF3592 domain-containing protein n=1 Tax=Peterkaempfera griseoplana TaxID=66896 RepID=UPI0006E3AC00|nr:DUF3592 domain-containing protein [Peterkaempfera griseoplana]